MHSIDMILTDDLDYLIEVGQISREAFWRVSGLMKI
jgi:hypothetical protein